MKKKYIFGIVVIIVLTIVGFFVFGANGKSIEQAEAAPAELSVLATSVWSGSSEASAAETKVGTSTIPEGGYIKTGDKGRAFLIAGKAQIMLDYNSELTLAANTAQGSSAELLVGAVWSRVEKLLDRGEYSEIKTKNAVASVRGTSYGVYYDGEETRLLVTEGTVQFTPRDAEGKLQSGKAVYVKAGNKAVKKGNEDFVVSELTFNDTEDAWFTENAPDHVLPDEEAIKAAELKAKEEQKKEEIKNNTTSTSNSGSSNTAAFALISISPKTADIGSGETITLSGRGFKTVSKVEANGTSISFKTVNDTTIEIIAGEELPEDIYDIEIKSRTGETSTLRQALEIRELGRSINEADR